MDVRKQHHDYINWIQLKVSEFERLKCEDEFEIWLMNKVRNKIKKADGWIDLNFMFTEVTRLAVIDHRNNGEGKIIDMTHLKKVYIDLQDEFRTEKAILPINKQ